MTTLVYIPARSGSKSLKNKNVKKICNKSLIELSYEFAKKIKIKKIIFISTDKKEYLVKNYNHFNYLRPKKISGDKSPIIDGILDCLNFFEKKKIFPKNVLLLQPTSPFRSIIEFKKGIDVFFKKDLESLVGVTKMKEHPNECLKKIGNNWYPLLSKTSIKKQRQEYNQNFYFIDGSFYIAKVDFLKKKKKFFRL
jgi:CMP-N-acetylneuraminic acid synthetase